MQSTTEFPDGTSLTLTLKDDIDPTQIVSDYHSQASEAVDRQAAIDKLSKRRKDAGTPHEAQQITAKIKEWDVIPSFLTINNNLILTVTKSWDLKDAITGEDKPFDDLNVKLIHFTRKELIAKQILEDLGFDIGELTDPKGSSAKSSSQLTQREDSANSPNGLTNSAQING